MGSTEDTLKDAVTEIAGTAMPGFGWAIGRAFGLLCTEWQRLHSAALKAAVRVSGLSYEDLQERIESDPELMPLYVRVLWAAGTNGHDETLRAMGATLGEAVRATAEGADADPQSMRDADQALVAMDALGPRHFSVLRLLATPGHIPENIPDKWRVNELTEALGFDEERVRWCLSGLAAAGLAIPRGSTFGGEWFAATNLGRAVVHASDLVAES